MRVIITQSEEVQRYIERISKAADEAVRKLQTATVSGVDLLREVKFEKIGNHPLEERSLNFIEQVNQTFTYLVSFHAVSILFGLHEAARGFRLNLGVRGGFDIESLQEGMVVAETFAAVTPYNNNKLNRDLARLAGVSATARYVFFASPGYSAGRQKKLEVQPGVQVWAVDI